MRVLIPWRLLMLMLPLGLTAGCSDGPMFALKSLNPYYRRQWARDAAMGPTYYDRIAELRQLRSTIGGMPPADQDRWLELVASIVQEDPSIEMRREAVLAAGETRRPLAVEILQAASQDESEKVRMAVCAAAQKQDPADAMPMLQTLIRDEDTHGVKPQAILALGKFDSPQSRTLLAEALAERSPAIQLAATQALGEATGQPYGGDVAKWKSYLAGEAVEPTQVSVATRAAEMLRLR